MWASSENRIRVLAALVVLALFAAGTVPVRAPVTTALDIVEPDPSSTGIQFDLGHVEGFGTIFADVVIDEEFTERHGVDWEDTLALMLNSANDVLKPIGVRIEMVSLSTLESSDDQTHMSQILDGALHDAQRGVDRILLAVTCQDSVRLDGVARESESAVIVRYNHDEWQRNGSLIAHEVGHLLGAEHHPVGEKCESDGCLMEPAGYVHATEWCDDHRDDIGALLAATARS